MRINIKINTINRESRNRSICVHCQLLFDKDVKSSSKRESKSFQQMLLKQEEKQYEQKNEP